MPYINFSNRMKFNSVIEMIPEIKDKGELEYLLFRILKKYMNNREHKYSNLHDTVYACIHTGEEFKRRYLDKREDKAMKENGDI